MRKRRTREHIITDLGVNQVERFVLRCGWTVERTRHDYGVDLLMETYNEAGEVENGRIVFQLKATDHPRQSSDGSALSATADRAHWLYVQDYFRSRAAWHGRDRNGPHHTVQRSRRNSSPIVRAVSK
jgi:hypothetical protein